MENDELDLIRSHYAGAMIASSNFTAFRYIDLVDLVGRNIEPRARVLDWGAGLGQVSLLLKNRGYDVTAFDIIERPAYYDGIDVKYVSGGDDLPFKDCIFDAVVACGALEHVDRDRHSLSELRRVLKPGGLLFIFNLPNKYSLIEFFARHTSVGGHFHLYDKNEIRSKLLDANFEVVRIEHAHMLPHNPSRMSLSVKSYDTNYVALRKIDHALESIPLLRFFSNEWIAVARRTDPTIH